MRTGLTAEKRPDKNGRLVTRWVNSGRTGAPTRKPLPSPTAPHPPASSLRTCERAVEDAYATAADMAYDIAMSEAEALRGITRLGGPVVRAYADAIVEEPDKDWGTVLLSVLNESRSASDAGHILAIVRAENDIDADWGGSDTGCWTFKHADKVRRGMDHLREQGVHVPVSGLDADGSHDNGITELARLTLRVAYAYDRATRALLVEGYGPQGRMLHIRDLDVASLILARPQDSKAISDLYLRGNLHGAAIQGIIDGQIPAPLGEGAL